VGLFDHDPEGGVEGNEFKHAVAVIGDAPRHVSGWFAGVHRYGQDLADLHFFQLEFGADIVIWAVYPTQVQFDVNASSRAIHQIIIPSDFLRGQGTSFIVGVARLGPECVNHPAAPFIPLWKRVDTLETVCKNPARMRALVRSALDATLPRRCGICRQGLSPSAVRVICSACWDAIPRIQGPRCSLCGIPFASEAAVSHSPAHRCGACRDTPPSFTQAVAAGMYAGVLADAIRRCKYQKQVDLVSVLGELLDPVLKTLPPVDAVVAVPLHVRRLREREFNQSLRIAAWVAQRLDRPLWPNALRRIRWTDPQTTLDRADRQTNVRRAFAVRDQAAVRGRRLALVDDVYTTGATVNECARALRSAGASDVYVVTVAHMP
jgi:ComF family protein